MTLEPRDATEPQPHHLADPTLVDRYLAGRLAGDEEEAFEAHLVECAACREEVAWAEDLAGSMRTAAAASLGAAAAVSSIGARRLGQRAGWRAAGAGLALAALLALGIATAFLARRDALLRREVETLRASAAAASVGGAPAETLLVSLGAVRGKGGEVPRSNVVKLPRRPAWIVLSVEPPAPERTTYAAVLEDAAGRTVWRGDGLAPGALDTLLVGLPSRALAPGDYRLRLTPAAGGRTVIPFRVEAASR